MKLGKHCEGCMHSIKVNQNYLCLKLTWTDGDMSSFPPEEGCSYYTDKVEEYIKNRSW